MSIGPIRPRRTSLCIGSSFQVPDILQYASQGHFFQGACGLKPSPAVILNQDPVCEMAYKEIFICTIQMVCRNVQNFFYPVFFFTVRSYRN